MKINNAHIEHLKERYATLMKDYCSAYEFLTGEKLTPCRDGKGYSNGKKTISYGQIMRIVNESNQTDK